MEDIDNKFDRAEKFVERGGKLILKIVTGVVGIVLAIVFAWGQVQDTLDDHGIHIHSEDKEFQEYLIEVETSAGYYEEEVDSAYEDSLYNDYYSLDTIVEGVNDTDVVDIIEEIDVVIDTIIPIDTVIIDTIEIIE